jgi:hypothetical protein
VRASVSRIVFFGPAAPLNYSRAGFGPSNHLLRANSASALFECGFRSLELFSSGRQRRGIIRVWALLSLESSSSGQQCLCIIRVRVSVPQIILFGPAAPWYYSSVGSLVPRIAFFGPAAPLCYSSAGFGPSNHFLRASSASILFECGLRSLESFSLGQQRLHIIRVRASVPRIIFFGLAAPLHYLSVGFRSLESHLSAISAFILFGYGPLSFESLFRAINALLSSFPKHGSNKPVRMPYVKYEGKSTVNNTRWPGIRIKCALPRNFPYLRYEVCIDGRIECLTLNWASTW